MSRTRRFTFTTNQAPDEAVIWLRQLAEGENSPKYLIFGREVAPTTGRVHLQGYVHFTSGVTFARVKELLPPVSHIEQARGTGQQNRTYCSKDGDFEEFGSLSSQGTRTDLDRVRELADEGATLEEIADECFGSFLKYRKNIEAYLLMKKKKKMNVRHPLSSFPASWQGISTDEEKSVILWGEPGIGKTSLAKAMLPQALFVSHMDDLGQYDPKHHDGIIFDDMSFTHMPRPAQIHIVDFDEPRSIHIRYQVAHIPERTKKIFCTNDRNGHCVDLTDGAISRRCSVHHLVMVEGGRQ